MKSQTVQVGAKGKQDWETPDEFFSLVNREFNFKWDLAASPLNAKSPQYFDEYMDSLSRDWHKIDGWCWLNPPFGNIRPWAAKCLEESQRGGRIVMLTLASTGSNWFRECCWELCELRFLNGRLKFKGAEGPFPKDLALYIFAPDQFKKVTVWDWRKAL